MSPRRCVPSTPPWSRVSPVVLLTSPMGAGSRSSPALDSPAEPFCGWWSAPAAGPGMAMLTRELIGRLPKAELHVHLDGSLRPETMIELARDAKVPLPAYEPEPLGRFMLVDDAANLQDFLDRFDFTIPLLQTPEAIERVAYEMVEDAAGDNVRYLEVRYCPHLSQRGGLTLDQVMEAELQGLERGERDFGCVARVINCSLRHYDPARSVEIAECSVRFRNRGVVAFDLAGGEAGRPAGNHREAFRVAEEGLLGITVHAGEAAG